MAEADLRAVLAELAGRSFDTELQQWVHSTQELPLQELLAAHGVCLQAEAPQLAQRLGLRVQENHGLQIRNVLRGGPAEQAGMMAGDEWLAVESPAGADCWRVTRLDDVPLYAGDAPGLIAWVARDRQVLRLQLPWGAARQEAGAAPSNLGLEISDRDAARRWLDGAR